MPTSILHAHLDNCEKYLLALSEIPSISGHSLHKGTPREMFIREFLGEHLPSKLAIGTGELIDWRTEEGGNRNQHDIVIYKRSYPKIHLGGGINAFLRESVVATIEVKSTLKEKELKEAIAAANKAKQLENIAALPRPIANYVLAYTGPKKMKTVFKWIENSYRKLGLLDPEPTGDRSEMVSAAIDGVFLLGGGACLFENNVGFLIGQNFHKHSQATWSVMTSQKGSLLLLFVALVGLAQDERRNINPEYYIKSFNAPKLEFKSIRCVPPSTAR